ncbi:MAG: glycosyltransferase family 39 protein [Nitrospinota bacterium]|nr:glycosyltransferase family 39 protein [Nitrospinota bacterium]
MKLYPRRLTVFLILIVAVRLFLAARMELTGDEAYYWDWSRHLQWSYFDHPPLVALLIALTTWVGGNNELFVRMAAILPGTGLSVVAYFLGRDIFKSERTGFYCALSLNLVLIFAVGSLVITPDTPQIFFSALTLYFLFHAVFNGKQPCWYYAGLTLGFSLLSKYTGVLLVPCLALFLFFSFDHRRVFKQKEPYLALGLAALIFCPVIFWNAANDWMSFGFQLSHGFAGKAVQPLTSALEFLGSQVLLANPFVFVALAVAMVCCLRFWQVEQDDRLLFLPAFSVPIFLFFFLISFNSKVEGNWPAMAYFPATLAMVGLYFSHGGEEKTAANKGLGLMKKMAVYTGILIVVSVHIQGMFHLVSLPCKVDIIAKRAYGWQQLGRRVGKILRGTGPSREIFVFADRHQIAGELGFYIPGQPQTYRIHGRQRYPYLGDLNHLSNADGLYVFVEGRGNLPLVERYFDSMTELKSLPVIREGKIVRTFRFFLCKNYKRGLLET